MSSHANHSHSRYFVPDPSAWPFMLTVGLIALVYGVGGYLEDRAFHPGMLIWPGALRQLDRASPGYDV